VHILQTAIFLTKDNSPLQSLQFPVLVSIYIPYSHATHL